MIEDAFAVLGVPSYATAEQIRAAYHRLAQLYHPDHFPEGPERDAATRRMVRINLAYAEAMKQRGTNPAASAPPETPAFSAELRADVRSLLSMGLPQAAVQKLMRSECRDGEWHYWFGLAQLRMHDPRRAAFHLSQATRMRPQDVQCRAVYREALLMLEKQNTLWGRVQRVFRGPGRGNRR